LLTLGMSAIVFLVLACQRTHVGRREWIRMTPNEKTLYVRALIGHEKAKEAKGGNDRKFPRTAEEYVRSLDRAYAAGDTREVDVIFAEYAVTPRSPQPPPAAP
jgi:predicted Fe-S protein YdhL (DUF1289 family)